MYAVRGYFKPESSFHTIAEWETICNEFLALQKNGFDVRGGTIDYSPQLIDLINKYFSYQLYIETDQFPDLTRKKVLDFIEDFVNHKVWSLKRDYNDYIVNIDNDRIAFLYSRGAIEPYLLLDKQFTLDTYGTVDEEVTVLHWTSKEGEMVKNILNYETTHSWGSILADSKIFNQLNPSLSATWEDMKRSYNI